MEKSTSGTDLLKTIIEEADIQAPNDFESFICSLDMVGERMKFHGWIACMLMIIFKEAGVIISLSYLAGNGISMVNEEMGMIRRDAFIESIRESPHFKPLLETVKEAVGQVLENDHLSDDEVAMELAARLSAFQESIKTRVCLELITEDLPYVKYWLNREVEVEEAPPSK